jgi:PAS domain S-box-containing protein
MLAKQELSALTFDLNPSAMSISTIEGEILEVNRSFEAILGYSSEELIGRTSSDLGLFDPGSREWGRSVVGEGGHFEQLEIRLRKKNGDFVWVLGSVHPVEYQKRTCLLSSFVDINRRKTLEMELLESRELFVKAFDLNPLMMAVAQADSGRWINVNQAMVNGFGYAREEFIGRTAVELGLVVEMSSRETVMEQLQQRGFAQNFEMRVKHKSGRVFDVLGSAHKIVLDGQPCIISGHFDISEKKTIEKELIESRELFHLAFDLSPSMMSIIRVADLRYVSINQSFERGLGYSRETTLGRTSDELGITVDDQRRLRVADAIRSQGALNDFETRVRTRSGDIIDVLGSAETLTLGGELCILSVFFDITERKRAQRAWEQTQEDWHRQAEGQAALLATIVESSDDAIIGKTLEGTVISWNRGAERIFGYTAEEMVGQSILRLFPDELMEEEARILRQIKSGKVVSHYETVRLHKSGRRLDISITVSPIRDHNGYVVGASKIARDITERKRAEAEILRFNQTLEFRVKERTSQLQAANEELEAFAYAASHDLKAPLRAIDITTKWLEEDLDQHLTPDTRDTMNLLRRRVGRMEKLLDDLLAYSRVGRVVGEDGQEIISGDALIATILDLLVPPPSFVINVSPDFQKIRVPRMPLQQVLFNLISNAVKHHDKPRGVIEVGCVETDDTYVFSVKDDGPGIAPEFHDRIFKMFQKLKPQAEKEGSGIGLALVEKNVKVFGGAVSLESAEGQGSTFRIDWPKQQVAKV